MSATVNEKILNALNMYNEGLQEKISENYVEKDGNKVLSSNDFTTAEKEKLGGLSNFDPETLSDTFVFQVAGKDLSTNDFTDDYKAAIDGLSSAGSNFDPETLTDTFVLQVAGKVLSSNDFTDADKTKLDNLPAISVFMKALLETNNATEARSLLKVGREDIWDETGNRWNCVNAFLDTGTKKIGTSSLHTGVNNGYLVKPDGITLGGSYGFTIAFWAYASSASTAAQGFWSFGSKEAMIQIFRDASNKIATNCVVNGSAVFSPASADRTAYPTGQWNHVELDYNASNGYLYLFLNGTLIYSIACSFFSTAQNYPMYIGLGGLNGTLNYFTGWIDEFVVLKTCLHTASFTKPTSAYTAGTNTLALLHFD